MKLSRGLIAGVTASGALLYLTGSADSRTEVGPDQDQVHVETISLSLRVEHLREKFRSLAHPIEEGNTKSQINNVVQFFNFFNCFRPGWRNC
jgi:hypothetical protein